MAEPDDPSAAGARPTGTTPPRMPRWVLLTLIVVAAAVVLLVVLELTDAAGDHGPGRHTPGEHEPPAEHGS